MKILIILLLCATLLILYYFVPVEVQQCEMSWMRPVYFPIAPMEHRFSSKYKLFSYKENSRDPTLRGKPLLFVHGNAGGYKQVRSIAGALQIGRPNEFDVFTIDFNEELSISLHTIRQQTEFVQYCVDFILKQMYGGKFTKMSF